MAFRDILNIQCKKIVYKYVKMVVLLIREIIISYDSTTLYGIIEINTTREVIIEKYFRIVNRVGHKLVSGLINIQ